MSMVVGVFESLVNAQDAVADLVASGYPLNTISLLVREGKLSFVPDEACEHPVEARATTAMHDASSTLTPPTQVTQLAKNLPDNTHPDAEGSLLDTLENTGLKPDAAQFFADAICNGAVLVAVYCAAPRAPDARDILDVYNDSNGGPPVAQRHSLM